MQHLQFSDDLVPDGRFDLEVNQLDEKRNTQRGGRKMVPRLHLGYCYDTTINNAVNVPSNSAGYLTE